MWNRPLFIVLTTSLCSLILTACHKDNKPPPGVDPGIPVSTFSIGGTVTGSTGALTLQNSNGTQLVVAASGAFTFATAMPSGASYNVTVATPPTSQSCAVTNGSGTVLLSNVTNISVTCTNNTFTVGGTVTGLSVGKTLVLHLGADFASSDHTVTADGAFTFPVTLVDNAEFIVEVFTQPAGQTCSVANGTGDIAGASVTNVAVTCINSSASSRDWQPALNIATDSDAQDSNGIRTPRVAYDAAGNALAVWGADVEGGGGIDINWSRRPVGGAWTAPAKIPDWAPPLPDPSLGEARHDPVLAVAPNGTAVAAWLLTSYMGSHVMASTFSPATGWTTPEFLWRKHPAIDGGAVDLNIAADSAGNILVVWAATGTVYYNRYSPGTGWVDGATVEGDGRKVSQLSTGPATEPVMALNAAGQAVAIWRQGIDATPLLPYDFDLWSSRYDMATDTWTAPQQLEDGGGTQFYGKSLVIDAGGTATALWSDYDGDRLHIRASRLVGSSWSPPSLVETGNTSDTGFAFDPHAVVDGNGNVMVVWQQGDVDTANFVASRYVPDTVWGGQQVIGAYVGSSSVIFSTELTLAGNSAGHVVAVWTLAGCILPENVPCPTDVLANEYNPANGDWGAEEVIDKEDNFPAAWDGNASTPHVAVDAAGNAVAVWDQDGTLTTDGIRSSVFE